MAKDCECRMSLWCESASLRARATKQGVTMSNWAHSNSMIGLKLLRKHTLPSTPILLPTGVRLDHEGPNLASGKSTLLPMSNSRYRSTLLSDHGDFLRGVTDQQKKGASGKWGAMLGREGGEMKFGWKIILGSIIGFLGSAFRTVEGVGGGGIFVHGIFIYNWVQAVTTCN
ncbi:hypothetical protein JHK87_003846 [Glycine soja]|nr:hypothetical protein JHK87_003846 [Glycine soja]